MLLERITTQPLKWMILHLLSGLVSTITTNRADIAWGDSPILGVGAGASKYLKPKVKGMVPHVEFSRLLAEHGVFGLFFIIVLLFSDYRVYWFNTNPLMRGILMALWILAIYTTFHNAMRTYATPLLLGLSLLWVEQYLPASPDEQSS